MAKEKAWKKPGSPDPAKKEKAEAAVKVKAPIVSVQDYENHPKFAKFKKSQGGE